MKNGITTLEDSWSFSYKAKPSLSILLKNCTPRYLYSQMILKCMFTKKPKQQQTLHVNVYSSFIHNLSKFKATKM